MGKTKTDIVIEISFDTNDPGRTVVRTNAKRKALEGLFGSWLRGQIGRGRDTRPPNEKDVYTIRIRIGLSGGSFLTESDTGNKSLTCGLGTNVRGRLNSIRVMPPLTRHLAAWRAPVRGGAFFVLRPADWERALHLRATT